MLLDEADLELGAQLGRPGDLQHLPDRLETVARAAQQPGRDVLAIGRRVGVDDQTGHRQVLRGCDHALGSEVDGVADAGCSLDRAPGEAYVSGCAPGLGEQEGREEAGTGIGQASVFDPEPATIRGGLLTSAVAVAPCGLDVVAELLPRSTECVDIARRGVGQPRDECGQGHEGRLSGLVPARQLRPTVREPVLGGVELPQVDHAGPQDPPPISPCRCREAAQGRGVDPRGEVGVARRRTLGCAGHAFSSNRVAGSSVTARGS